VKAIRNLEVSLSQDRPRALIQMATGSGKTFTAVASVYRLVKFGGSCSRVSGFARHLADALGDVGACAACRLQPGTWQRPPSRAWSPTETLFERETLSEGELGAVFARLEKEPPLVSVA
jgi:hypothetical protein